MKIGTLNVNGLNANRGPARLKLTSLDMLIQKHKIDILLLQETHIDKLDLGKKIAEQLGGNMFWSLTGDPLSKGAAIFISKSCNANIVKFHHDIEGRLIYVDIDKGLNYRLVNIYAPNDPLRRKEFFNNLIYAFNTSRQIILGGDFNCVADTSLDKIGGNLRLGTAGWKELSKVNLTRKLVDVFRYFYPNTISTTWSQNGVACRFDRFYVPQNQLHLINSIQQYISFSDHELVVIDMKDSDDSHSRGKGAWKFPNYLVEDLDYSYDLCFQLAKFIDNHDIRLLYEWWDDFKDHAKETTSRWCKRRKKVEDITYGQLCSEYREHEKNKNIAEMTRVKNIIDANEEKKARGEQVRAKAQILDSNENPSAYFVHKEIHQGRKKNIEQIEVNGVLKDKQKEIVNAFKDFYTELYTAEHVQEVSDDYLQGLPKLENNEELGSKITLEEIRLALGQMENNKSPGPDGLSKEFYLQYFDLVAPLLVRLYENVFTNGQLTTSMKNSYITLICKDKNAPHLCKNYRPISLLNTDYKVITKVLSNRLRNYLPMLIHPDQSCSVKGRSIQDNCHYLRDIVDYINDGNETGVLLSLDQEKAFDRVNHNYLMSVLRFYGFDNNFVKWIEILYNDISSSVVVNGHISDPFNVRRSVRQGCPLSPLLYILSLEPVLNQIRKDPNIYGCSIPGKMMNPPKLTAFADDCKFVVKSDDSVGKIIKHFDNYSKFSGSKLSQNKSEVMYLGRWRDKLSSPQKIKVVRKMTIFGIVFGIDTENENWKSVLTSIQQKLLFYSERKLSLYGKAKLVNTMILPKIWYLATFYPPSKNILKKIEVSIFKFIWSGKQDKVNRDTMYLPIKDGGIGLVNIYYKYLSLFLAQMMKVFMNSDAPWVHFGHMYLGLLLRKFDGYSFSNCHPHRTITKPGFYKEVATALDILTRAYPDFAITSNMTSNTFYKLFMSSLKTKARVVNRYPLIDFKMVFSDLVNTVIDPVALNLTFNFVHDVVPAAYTLHLRGHWYGNPNCLRCTGCPETTDHLFLYCAYNHLAKQYLQHICFDALNHNIKPEDIRFGPQVRSSENAKILNYLISEYRLAVWVTRNKQRFENKKQGIRDSLNLFKNRIKFRIQADYIRLGQMIFERQWITTGLATVSDAGITFNY